MTHAAKAILAQAIALDPVDRAEVLEGLFRSFDARGSADNDAKWAQEAESRLDAHGNGQLKADDLDAVFERVNK